MRCPSCRQSRLQFVAVPGRPKMECCPQCRGAWLSAAHYETWRGDPSGDGTTTAPMRATVGHDTDHAKLCPACARILIRYRVDESRSFVVEHCGHCAGVWFDEGEWEELVACGTHVQLRRVFSASWQRRLLAARMAAQYEARVRDRIGASDYAELQRIRAWLHEHPQRSLSLAYLAQDLGPVGLNENPATACAAPPVDDRVTPAP